MSTYLVGFILRKKAKGKAAHGRRSRECVTLGEAHIAGLTSKWRASIDTLKRNVNSLALQQFSKVRLILKTKILLQH